MGNALGTILPQAIGVAISPVPIIAVILMLISQRARSNGSAFLLGWVLALTPLFYYLPEATLGAIVIRAVWGLLDVGEMRRYWRLRRTSFVLALTALLGVLVYDILPGLLLAVVLSLALLIYRASRPQGSILGRIPGKPVYRDRKSTRLNSSHLVIS